MASRETRGSRQLLRFRRTADVRRRLEAIVAAEAECCTFLKLELSEEADELVLSITAPGGGEQLANGLADAFASGRP